MRRKESYKSVRSITTPGQSINVRNMIDRITSGQPVGSTPTPRTPLPNDGEDEEDFTTGTKLYDDPVDAFEQQQEIDELVRKVSKEHADKRAETLKKQFDEKVEAAISARMAASTSSDAAISTP